MTATASCITDRQHLTAVSYKTQENLNTRILTHKRYTQPQIDFPSWALDQIEWRGDETAVDIGCGSGNYAEPIQQRCANYIAGDLSFGMLGALHQRETILLNLDAQAPPLADNVADVVLANHMLYHVPDKDAALAEIARILRPSGKLIATTNSAKNMAELIDLRLQVMKRLGLTVDSSWRHSPVANLFSLENGRSWLEKHFRHIERYDLPSALVFPTPEPLLNYISSSRDWYENALPVPDIWNDLLNELRRILDEHFAVHDELRISKLSGVFVCYQDE